MTQPRKLHTSPSSAVPMLSTNELAFERTRIASDRTLMAWVRTAVSLVGFGFSIPHFFRYLHDADARFIPLADGPFRLGMMLIALGTCGLLGGVVEHLKLLHRISPGAMGVHVRSSALFTALCMLAFGVFAFVNIGVRR